MPEATMFNTIAHCTTVFYYYHVLNYIANIELPSGDVSNHDRMIQSNFMEGRTKFFTMWSLAAQFILFTLCVVHDLTLVLSPSNAVRRAVRYVRDIVLVAVAGPIAVTVTAIFWGLWYVDRELVMPPALDAVIPAWLNHAMHSFVVVLVAVQLLAEPHRPPTLSAAFSVASALMAAYCYTFFNEYATSGRWMYPVYNKLDWPGKLAFTGFCTVLLFSQVLLFRAVVSARWGNEKKSNRTMKKHKD